MTFFGTLLLSTTLAAAPAYRGVVEGYYGRPWGTEGRVSLMDFMGERGLNTFIYGPKDDPYHHAKWREPYPEKEAADFRKLLAVAAKNGINFYWAIHLGDFNGEYGALFRKLESMYALGVRSFALFFDDFGAANAELHATIGNRVISEFLAKKGDCAPLLVCPNAYWGTGRPYQKTLGEKLDKGAMIMWTGRKICSDICAEDVARITADFRRPPFIWWNWPVSDYCRAKVLLGRLYGLDAGTYAGIVLNPMENCELNKIAIHSFGAWCRDPARFDSQKTWDEGFSQIVADPEVADALRVFARHNSDQGPNGQGYRREESVSEGPVCRAAREELRRDGRLTEGTREALRRIFRELERATLTLVRKLGRENPAMHWELEGWLQDELGLMACGLTGLDLLECRDGGRRQEAIDRLFRARLFQKVNRQAHVAKLREATFENDRRGVKPPRASDTELLPVVNDLLHVELAREYRARTGRDFADAFGLKALSGAAEFPCPSLYREEASTGLDRVFEPHPLAPGEWIGLQIPEGVAMRAFDVRLGNGADSADFALELSTDGKAWQALADVARTEGRLFAKELPAGAWRAARVRNASEKAVDVKLDFFRLDVTGTLDPVDALLEALSGK